MGELVDDAIVDVENIFRRLKEKQSPRQSRVCHSRGVRSQQRDSQRDLVRNGRRDSCLPASVRTFRCGRPAIRSARFCLYRQHLSSFLVSLTVTPVLSYYLLPNSGATHRESDGPVLRGLKAIATPLIRTSMAIPGSLLVITWIVVGIAGWQLAQLGRNFLPAFDEGSVQVNVTLPPGSSLQASNQVSSNIDDVFLSMQKSSSNPNGEILNFVRRTGRAEMDEHASPVNFGEYILSMNPEADHNREEMLAELLDRIHDEVPGVDIEVEQPLAHLISHMVSGVYAQIAIKIHGDDLDQLLSLAEKVKNVHQRHSWNHTSDY